MKKCFHPSEEVSKGPGGSGAPPPPTGVSIPQRKFRKISINMFYIDSALVSIPQRKFRKLFLEGWGRREVTFPSLRGSFERERDRPIHQCGARFPSLRGSFESLQSDRSGHLRVTVSIPQRKFRKPAGPTTSSWAGTVSIPQRKFRKRPSPPTRARLSSVSIPQRKFRKQIDDVRLRELARGFHPSEEVSKGGPQTVLRQL